MKEHIDGKDRKKAKRLVVILSVLLVGLGVAAAFLMKGGGTLYTVLAALCGVTALSLVCLVMHDVRRSAGGDFAAKCTCTALHGYAIHAVLFIGLLFAGGVGSFSYGVVHALLDGALAAMVLLLIGTLFAKKPLLPGVILGIVAAAISLFAFSTVLNILFAALGLVLVVLSLLKIKNPVGIHSLLLGGITAGMSIFALLAANAPNHLWLHLLALLAAAGFYFALPAVTLSAAGRKDEAATGNDEAAAGNDEAAAGADEDKQTAQPREERWIVKKYEKLSDAELILAPVDALYGVSAGDAQLLKEAFGIKTIGDLANNKFFAWAEEIAEQAKG